jgi:5-(aminomethyl)-3-furanmethanol phosphate kinase
MPIRIVKVGGSLLDWPPLPQALLDWLDGQALAFNVLVCGSGPLADAIRRADRDFSLGEEASHWLCIEAMSLSARLLHAVLRDIRLVVTFDALVAVISKGQPGTAIFDPRELLSVHEPGLPGRSLPHDWSVSSDSIAARLAEVVLAQELVLLKSCDSPSVSLGALAAMGLVDSYFPVAAAGLSGLRIVNLRREAGSRA